MKLWNRLLKVAWPFGLSVVTPTERLKVLKAKEPDITITRTPSLLSDITL